MDVVEKRSTPSYKEAFIKTLQGTATQEQRALVTVSTGASVIPTELFNQIIDNVQKQQGILSRVRILQVPGKMSIPLGDINTPATFHTEGDEILDSNTVPTNLTLSGYELVKLFSMSAATRAMSIPAFESYLIQELTRCTSDALNQVIFTGDGTGEPSGLGTLTYNSGNSVTTSVKVVSIDNLVKALSLLASNYRQSACFIMNSAAFYTYIATAKDDYGRPLFIDANNGGGLRLVGKEVIIDDFAPNDTIYVGDPSHYFINFSEPLKVETSTEAGFTKNVTMYKSSCVVDGKPNPLGFVKIAIPQA